MLEQLRNWLNGTRDYWIGIVLYDHFGNNDTLKELFKRGESSFNRRKLDESLHAIWDQKNSKVPEPAEKLKPPAENSELITACKLKADKEYKKIMNMRAVLFQLTNTKGTLDPNTPDLIKKRSQLALEVVSGYNHLSQLYDTVEFVKKTGRLPDQDLQENDVNLIPDHLVKQTLDNSRKNVNKLKKREQTPERIALIQYHEKNIEILIHRWQKIKIDG